MCAGQSRVKLSIHWESHLFEMGAYMGLIFSGWWLVLSARVVVQRWFNLTLNQHTGNYYILTILALPV